MFIVVDGYDGQQLQCGCRQTAAALRCSWPHLQEGHDLRRAPEQQHANDPSKVARRHAVQRARLHTTAPVSMLASTAASGYKLRASVRQQNGSSCRSECRNRFATCCSKEKSRSMMDSSPRSCVSRPSTSQHSTCKEIGGVFYIRLLNEPHLG
jgi:hypothetical protein